MPATTAPVPPTTAPDQPPAARDRRSAATQDPDARALFRCFRCTRDPRALELLVRRFLPLAKSLARRYYSGGEPLEDLEQVASLGLVKAVQRPRAETIGSLDDGYERADDRLTVNAAVRKLAPRERRILRMRVIEDRTQADIVARIGVSQMQVSRLLRRTLDRLQHTVEHEPTLASG